MISLNISENTQVLINGQPIYLGDYLNMTYSDLEKKTITPETFSMSATVTLKQGKKQYRKISSLIRRLHGGPRR